MKTFDKRNFLKHQSFLQRKFLVQWDENFDGKPWYRPLLSIKKFSKPEVFWNTTQNGSLVKFFRSCERKEFSTKWWSFPPPLLETLRYQNFFETQNGSLTAFIATVRQRFFNGIGWYPLLMHKKSRCTKFFDRPKCSPTKFFGTVRQQFLYRKTWYSPRRHRVFRYPKLSET